MAIYLVTYDLKQPGRNYTPVHEYLRQFTYCKRMESAWLIETTGSAQSLRDGLIQRVDTNDVVFVARLTTEWGSFNYGCAEWLNAPERRW